MFLEISQNLQENTCARVSFLIKLQASGLQFSLKKRLWHSCFPMNFVKFLRTPFFIEYLWWLLLNSATFWCLIIKIEIEIVTRFSKITIKCCRLKHHFVLHFLVLTLFWKIFYSYMLQNISFLVQFLILFIHDPWRLVLNLKVSFKAVSVKSFNKLSFLFM